MKLATFVVLSSLLAACANAYVYQLGNTANPPSGYRLASLDDIKTGDFLQALNEGLITYEPETSSTLDVAFVTVQEGILSQSDSYYEPQPWSQCSYEAEYDFHLAIWPCGSNQECITTINYDFLYSTVAIRSIDNRGCVTTPPTEASYYGIYIQNDSNVPSSGSSFPQFLVGATNTPVPSGYGVADFREDEGLFAQFLEQANAGEVVSIVAGSVDVAYFKQRQGYLTYSSDLQPLTVCNYEYSYGTAIQLAYYDDCNTFSAAVCLQYASYDLVNSEPSITGVDCVDATSSDSRSFLVVLSKGSPYVPSFPPPTPTLASVYALTNSANIDYSSYEPVSLFSVQCPAFAEYVAYYGLRVIDDTARFDFIRTSDGYLVEFSEASESSGFPAHPWGVGCDYSGADSSLVFPGVYECTGLECYTFDYGILQFATTAYEITENPGCWAGATLTQSSYEIVHQLGTAHICSNY